MNAVLNRGELGFGLAGLRGFVNVFVFLSNRCGFYPNFPHFFVGFCDLGQLGRDVFALILPLLVTCLETLTVSGNGLGRHWWKNR